MRHSTSPATYNVQPNGAEERHVVDDIQTSPLDRQQHLAQSVLKGLPCRKVGDQGQGTDNFSEADARLGRLRTDHEVLR
jgi:hypothetical protein